MYMYLMNKEIEFRIIIWDEYDILQNVGVTFIISYDKLR